MSPGATSGAAPCPPGGGVTTMKEEVAEGAVGGVAGGSRGGVGVGGSYVSWG